jgi:hypothetical protein
MIYGEASCSNLAPYVTPGQAMISVGLQCRQSRRGRRGDREHGAGSWVRQESSAHVEAAAGVADAATL